MGGFLVMRLFRTNLGKSLGLGSSKSGVEHWKWQRITAVALVPLLLWFVASVSVMVPAPYSVMMEWLASPVTMTSMIILALALIYHGFLGMQVVIEDYVHNKFMKSSLILITKFACFYGAVLAILSCVIILLGY